MDRRRLGAMVTPDAINNFFSLQTQTNPNTVRRVQPVVRQPLGLARTFSELSCDENNEGPRRLEFQLRSPPVNSADDAFEPFQFPSTADEDANNELMRPELDADDAAAAKKIVNANVLDVYKNYTFDHTYDPSLPITDFHETVISTIESNQVTIIQGSTGSGKSTQVVQYILDHYKSRNKYCNIILTQPRRIAAISIAKRICQERGWQLGTVVGYQVARDRQASEDTRLTLVTTGVLLQKLIQNRNMNEFTHVILDEIHERDQDIDFSMLVVRKFLRTMSSHVRVVLMSATMDCSLYSKYFSICLQGKFEEAPVVAVEGRMFDIEEFYLNDLMHLQETLPSLELAEPSIPEVSYYLVKQLISHFDDLEIQDQGVVDSNSFSPHRGTVLIFLPGYPEIETMFKFIDNIVDDLQLWVLPLHSQITSAEQNRVFERAPPGKRKVILSTNIAESSITVPDIKYVIDFCRVKNLEQDSETNLQRLRLDWASQASLTQRRGRAGRVSSGKCYRMITKYFYHQLLPYSEPEMTRCPLEQTILKVKLLDIGDPHQTLKHAIQPPAINDIRRTILMLKEVGALTVMQQGRINPFNGDLTSIGRVVASLPVDVKIGKLIIMGHVFGYLEECIVIGAALSLKSIFSRPFKKEFAVYRTKMDWANWSQSDCIASLNAYKEWKLRKSKTGFGNGGERKWGEANMIQTRMMREMDELVNELANRLKKFNLVPKRRIIDDYKDLTDNDLLILKIVICGAFFPNYIVSGEVNEEEAEKTMCGLDPFTTVMLHGVPEPGLPYTSAIGRLLRQCGKGKQITFENTRAYVEFERPPVRTPSPVLPAVYLAVKMRQLRLPLVLYTSKEKSEEAKLNWKQSCHTDDNYALRTDRVTATLDSNGRLNPLSKQANQIQLDVSPYANIFVSEVVDAGHFWAHYGLPTVFQQLQLLQQTINSHRHLKKFNGMPMAGWFCLAPYEDELYRAKILFARGDSAQVIYLDYGNTCVVPLADLRECPDELLLMPFQAFECHLAGIRPVQGAWTVKATEMVRSRVIEKVFVAKVFSIVRNSMRLHLFIDDDREINDLLVREGFAEVTEESYASKVANEQLINKHKVKPGGEVVTPSDRPDWMEDEGRAMSTSDTVSKVRLRGPVSAYELSFGGLTSQSAYRVSRIERDSVNSVVISEEPQDKHPRLIVSAAVGVNSAGNTLICRDTTMLPNIHGVDSLVPLLFAPVAELRSDRRLTRYTGALCGLGYDTDARSSILPDHDIEISFRIQFTMQDLIDINSVRTCINEIVGREQNLPEWSGSVIERLQNAAKTRVLRLFNTHRGTVEPVHFPKPYKWNEVPPDFILNANSPDEGACLYMLHNGIILASDIKKTMPELAKRRQAVVQLRDLAGPSTEPFPQSVVCAVCNVSCRHPFGLSQHIRTNLHKREEAELFNDAAMATTLHKH